MYNIPPQETPANDPTMIPDQKSIIDQVIAENRVRPGAMMVVLNELQTKIGYISRPMEHYIAKSLGMPVGSVHGVVTFYSFFTTKPPGEGTGLGLYISHNIVVQKHKGEISVSSRPGNTCFKVKLPLKIRQD